MELQLSRQTGSIKVKRRSCSQLHPRCQCQSLAAAVSSATSLIPTAGGHDGCLGSGFKQHSGRRGCAVMAMWSVTCECLCVFECLHSSDYRCLSLSKRSFLCFSKLQPLCSSGEGDAGVCNYISNKAWIWSTCLKVNPLSNPALLTTKRCLIMALMMLLEGCVLWGDISGSAIICWNYSISRTMTCTISVWSHMQHSYVMSGMNKSWTKLTGYVYVWAYDAYVVPSHYDAVQVPSGPMHAGVYLLWPSP